MKSRKTDILMALSLVAFITIALLTNFTSIFENFDKNTIIFLHNIARKHSLNLALFITDLGYVYGISMISLIISAALAYFKNYKEAVLIALSTNTALQASLFFKEIFKRARPAVEYHLINVDHYSFPSGHMLMSVCFYGALIFVICRTIKSEAIRIALKALMVITILAIGLSRNYLGVHYPTDVLGSLFLGLFIIFFWIKLLKIQEQQTIEINE
jgi:undecaprenyl-diphosphatase